MSRTRILPSLAAAALCATGCLDVSPGRTSSEVEGEVCGLHETDIENVHGPFATLTVSNTDTHLVVEVTPTDPDLYILDLYLDAAAGPITAASGGYINYFAFPFQAHFTYGALPTSYTFEIPLGEVRGLTAETCGQSINVALYSKMKIIVDGQIIGAKSGWAFGANDCPQNHDDGCGWFGYDFCECPPPPPPPPPPPDDDQGCTLTMGYWKTHNQYAPKRPLRVDWPAPYDENDLLCGLPMLTILQTPSNGNAWFIVAHQYIAAILNVASGASTTEGVDAAIAAAREFLLGNCGGVPASEAGDAIAIGQMLDDYNNGVIGPGHCE